MEELNDFEKAVLAKLLYGDHPLLAEIRSQAEKARLISRTNTGTGFYCKFMVPSDVAPLTYHKDFHFGDVVAKIEGLEYGAGFVIFIRNGRLDTLEGYSYEEPWPNILGCYDLHYLTEPRSLNIPGN